MINRLRKLFAGMEEAYGTYDIQKNKGLKQVGQAMTIRLEVETTREQDWIQLWVNHVNGVRGLGVIPITEDETCWWGCIDIDNYQGLDYVELKDKILKLKLPLIVCRSKSGGAHVFLFMNEPAPAELIINKLREMASALGQASAEVFPKQSKVLKERGDLGNWLNMPYFDVSKTVRYAVDFEGKAMSLESFLDLAEASRITVSDLENLTVEIKKVPNQNDMPPCLQYLLQQGIPEGSRNNFIYNAAVYARKAFPENEWRQVLEQYNYDYCNPPLSAGEIVTIQKSMDGKEYRYKCSEAPLVAFCNPAICKTRKHGINASSSMPVLSSLAKLDTDPPLWFINVDEHRLELATIELQDPKKFQLRCMEQLNMMPPIPKQADWQQIIQALMPDLIKYDAPKDVGVEGTFYDLLDQFCTGQYVGTTRDELLRGKPWTDYDTQRTYFRLQDLMEFLSRKKFVAYTRPKITMKIKKLKGDASFFKIKGKGVNVWWIPIETGQTEQFEVPKFNENIPF